VSTLGGESKKRWANRPKKGGRQGRGLLLALKKELSFPYREGEKHQTTLVCRVRRGQKKGAEANRGKKRTTKSKLMDGKKRRSPSILKQESHPRTVSFRRRGKVNLSTGGKGLLTARRKKKLEGADYLRRKKTEGGTSASEKEKRKKKLFGTLRLKKGRKQKRLEQKLFFAGKKEKKS